MAREIAPDAAHDHAPKRVGQKTYWHLLHQRRVPTDYEVVTTRLHYYPALGFAVDTPVSAWYRDHQPFALGEDAGAAFADPRHTTYTDYVRLKHEQETHLERSCAPSAGEPLADSALALWARVIAPLRFPLHGLQMCASYAGSMTPWSRLTVALAFQAADEVQRIDRIAQRLAQLRSRHPMLGSDGRGQWERAAAWQGVREIVERILVAYDWIEGYVALNAVFKPRWERLIFSHCAHLARAAHDPALASILECYAEDGRWHGACTDKALAVLCAHSAPAKSAVDGYLERWLPIVHRGLGMFADGLDELGGAGASAHSRLDAPAQPHVPGAHGPADAMKGPPK